MIHPHHLRGVVWTKAARSAANEACVEVARVGDRVAVHDSKNPHEPALAYTYREWSAFIDGAKKAEFDHFAEAARPLAFGRWHHDPRSLPLELWIVPDEFRVCRRPCPATEETR